MRNIGRSAGVALAGALAFAGGEALAHDKSAHGAATTASGVEGSQSSGGIAPKQGGAQGAATTEQQSRSTTSGRSSESSRQSSATERSGAPHAEGGASASSSGAAEANQLSGRVERFDRAASTLHVGGKTLKVDSNTEVMKDGSAASLGDVMEGDQVRASYSGSGDTLSARKIEITSGKTETGTAPAGRGGPMGPGTGAGQGDSTGRTSGTGTGSTGAAPDAGSSGSSTK